MVHNIIHKRLHCTFELKSSLQSTSNGRGLRSINIRQRWTHPQTRCARHWPAASSSKLPAQPLWIGKVGDMLFFLLVFFGWRPFWGIRSMNWECCIEYFIDCLLAPCWPAWHAKFLARWRRHVASHQLSHPWGFPAFPVNKLTHSGGGREARAQGHCGWDEEKTHTHSLSEEQNRQPWLQYELPWSKPDESSERIHWVETTWNLHFNYNITAQTPWMMKTIHNWLGNSKIKILLTK